jgi:hypothetical protein
MEKTDCSRGRRGFVSAGLTAMLLGGLVIGGPGFARAQDGAGIAGPASGDAKIQLLSRDLRTSQALLEGLERRRARIDPNSGDSATRYAIEFLDSRIKLLWSRIEKDMEFFRRAA